MKCYKYNLNNKTVYMTDGLGKNYAFIKYDDGRKESFLINECHNWQRLKGHYATIVENVALMLTAH